MRDCDFRWRHQERFACGACGHCGSLLEESMEIIRLNHIFDKILEQLQFVNSHKLSEDVLSGNNTIKTLSLANSLHRCDEPF